MYNRYQLPLILMSPHDVPNTASAVAPLQMPEEGDAEANARFSTASNFSMAPMRPHDVPNTALAVAPLQMREGDTEEDQRLSTASIYSEYLMITTSQASSPQPSISFRNSTGQAIEYFGTSEPSTSLGVISSWVSTTRQDTEKRSHGRVQTATSHRRTNTRLNFRGYSTCESPGSRGVFDTASSPFAS